VKERKYSEIKAQCLGRNHLACPSHYDERQGMKCSCICHRWNWKENAGWIMALVAVLVSITALVVR